jgi:glycosyltransferase involved in cell wall biosynthesis
MRLAVVGDGPERIRLEAHARGLSSKSVMFVGACAPSEVAAWMGSSDVLVLPSLSEGRPVVVVEAMARGLLAVVSDIPGNRELVSHGETGMLFQPGDPHSLLQCLTYCIAHPERATEMAKQARHFVKRAGLGMDVAVTRHKQAYRELVEATMTRSAAGV